MVFLVVRRREKFSQRFEGSGIPVRAFVTSLYNITQPGMRAARTLGLLLFTCSVARFMKVQQTGG